MSITEPVLSSRAGPKVKVVVLAVMSGRRELELFFTTPWTRSTPLASFALLVTSGIAALLKLTSGEKVPELEPLSQLLTELFPLENWL